MQCAGCFGYNLCAMTVMLPEERGTYVLIASASRMQRLTIGSFGKVEIVPGFYAYVGSAFGRGGLRARITHHLESIASPHWHLDYLLQVATPIEVWFSTESRKLERRWAECLAEMPGFREPIPRFGASDYHRSRTSHLFYSKPRPSFAKFEAAVRLRFRGVEAERARVVAAH